MRRGFDGVRIVSGESVGHSSCKDVAKIAAERSQYAVDHDLSPLVLINVTSFTVF
jgi:hypothetical protein